MKAVSLTKEISSTSYPGRGIVLGRSADGKKAVIAYFIMGRSENSRNRIFVETADGIKTEAFDPSKLVDPSLIIYAPVRVLGNKTIVTNGDQTLKSADGNPDCCERYTFSYDAPLAGKGRFIHTYMGDGNPLPSFEGEPTLVEIGDDDIDAFAQKVWDALDSDNKVSLFVRYIDVETGKADSRIINKNK